MLCLVNTQLQRILERKGGRGRRTGKGDYIVLC